MVAILMISAKLAPLGLFETNVFRNKGYEVIISVHGVTNNFFLSFDSNHIADVVTWPKTGNSNISMREVIIT